MLEDVEAEANRVKALTSYDNTPIVIKDIKKIFPGMDGGKPKVRTQRRCLLPLSMLTRVGA
jgi:hypothetical protein